MLGRAALHGPWTVRMPYLMLLLVEVAAFHPATPRPAAGARDTEVAVPVRV